MCYTYDSLSRVLSRTVKSLSDGTVISADSYIIFGYNGRDGVVTDNNGLIYMRARYYSPQLHRFINADVLHGEISDSTSLNRYSYVNGNPVSFVDPFGLERKDEMNRVESIIKMFSTVSELSAEKNKEFILEILNLFVELSKRVTISNRSPNATVNLGPTTMVSYSTSIKYGDSLIDISKEFNKQIDLLKDVSIATKIGDFDVVYNGESISIGATVNINDVTSMSVSISGVPKVSISANYSINANYQNVGTSTTMSFEHVSLPNNNPKKPVAEPVPIPVPVPAPAPEPFYKENSDKGYSMPGIPQEAILTIGGLAVVGIVGTVTPIPGDGIAAWIAFFFSVIWHYSDGIKRNRGR